MMKMTMTGLCRLCILLMHLFGKLLVRPWSGHGRTNRTVCYASDYHHIILLTYYTTYAVYNRTFTITRFIVDDNVAYQWVTRDIRLASDNSWARHQLKHVSWRSRWICFSVYTWTENGSFMRNLTSWRTCMPFWLVLLIEHKVDLSLLRDKRGLPLPGCGTIVPVLWLLFSRLSILPSCLPLSGNSLNSLRAPYCFDR